MRTVWTLLGLWFVVGAYWLFDVEFTSFWQGWCGACVFCAFMTDIGFLK